MFRCFLAVAGITFLFPAALSATAEPVVADANAPQEAAYIFFSGNELSTLRPCGCAEFQLGGFDKRSNVWKSISPDKRLIIDTGNLLLKTSDQDLVKFDIMIQAFAMLGYDAVNLDRQEYDIAAGRGYVQASSFRIITSPGSDNMDFRKELRIGDDSFVVNVLSLDPRSEPTEDIAARFGARQAGTGLNIVIYNRMFDKIDLPSFSLLDIDVVVCLSGSDTPEVLDKTRKRPLVISVGRYGKYIGKLTVDRPLPPALELTYQAVPVGQDLPSDIALVDLYKNYQQIVKEENLLDKYPRLPMPGTLEYVGSKSCKVCHEVEYAQCLPMRHSIAWKTLVNVGSQYDPECVVCHVVGLKYQGGFTSARKTPELRNVGCEECHGPGSRHVETLGKAKTEGPKAACTDCHTLENSPKYAGREGEYLSKILHWKEQVDANSVKK
jgi:hypothetical protein